MFATKSEVKENKEYSEKVYLKKRELPKIDFSPYLKKSDAESTYQPKGNYVKDLNFKDKLLSIAGVKYSIEDNGYICFGPLFGGLIIQWGKTQSTEYYHPKMTSFPIAFPNKAFCLVTNIQNGNDDTNWSGNIKNKSQFWIYSDYRPNYADWVAIGR